jgi:hypothetical protein
MKKFVAQIYINGTKGTKVEIPVFAKNIEEAKEMASSIQQEIDYAGSTYTAYSLQVEEDTTWIKPPFTADSKDYTD